ncbi:Non-catalytic module family EXPN protein [Schizopora paradoxa]|uniref:Non-catalytic module family EXPN protein n=1 Tax=Schizopora paradoxa TaxID=27342 RepID=A0A0H2RAW5_9AGAM|nr:Non-catalytic module family EXPN protein [Schizopora paradoxa]
MFSTQLFSVLAAVAVLAGSAVASPLETRNATVRVRAADVTHTGRGTFFTPGLGACGQTSTSSDPVVAIGAGRFGSGGNCFQWMKITANGVTAFGQTLDECESCGDSDIDMSPSLFQNFAPLSQGVVEVTWNFEPFGFQPPK